jgi:hypothetical protein
VTKVVIAIAVATFTSLCAHGQEVVSSAIHMDENSKGVLQLQAQKKLVMAIDQADVQLKAGNLGDAAKNIGIAKQVITTAEYIDGPGNQGGGLPFITNPKGTITDPVGRLSKPEKVITCDNNEQLLITGLRSAKCTPQQ